MSAGAIRPGRKACACADAARVKQLVIFHHDPGHDDAFMDRIAAAADKARPGTLVAHEGMIPEALEEFCSELARRNPLLRSAWIALSAASAAARLLHPLPLRRRGRRRRDRIRRWSRSSRAERPSSARGLRSSEAHLDRLLTIGHEPPPAPRFAQDWFPRLDAAMAYAMVRELRPARIVEIGSGHSTRFLARAVVDGELATGITAIDPAPRATLDGLPIRVMRGTVQAGGHGRLPSAAPRRHPVHQFEPHPDAGHRRRFPASTSVLPRCRPALYVHIHDVFLPDGYPAEWAWRGYNEQNVAASLLCRRRLRVRGPRATPRRGWRRMSRAAVSTGCRSCRGAHETSLWLVKDG